MQRAVIEEVRAIRDEIARESDYDIDAIFETSRRVEALSGRRHVTLKSRRPAQPVAAPDRSQLGLLPVSSLLRL
jgi:hypothetical protein